MSKTLTRRDLLTATLLAVLWSLLDRTLAQATEPDRLVDTYARLDARIGLRVANLGEVYLRRNPAEGSQSRIAELIGGLHGPTLRSALSQSELRMRTALRAAYSRDFEAGCVVYVEGWVVSLTEARLHAWRHLTTG